MASLLAKRIDALEARLGTGAQVAIGRTCPACGAHVELSDVGPCEKHRLLRAAEQTVVVTFVRQRDE